MSTAEDERASDNDVEGDAGFRPAVGVAERAEVDQLTATAVELLGSEDAAIDSLLLALDAGYTYSQITEALRTGSLGADGSIPGDPSHPPTDLVIGLRRAAPPERIDLEQLRRNVADAADDSNLGEVIGYGRADPQDAGGVSGSQGLRLVIGLIVARFPPQAIVEGLVIGLEAGFVPCRSASPQFNIPALRVGDTLYPPEYCGGPEQAVDDSDAPTDDSQQNADDTDGPPDDIGQADEESGVVVVHGELTLDDLGDIDEVVENEVSFRFPEDGGEFEGSVRTALRIVEDRFYATADAEAQRCVFDIVVTMSPAGTYDPVFETLEMTDSSVEFATEVVEGCVDGDLSPFEFAGEVEFSNPSFDGTTLTMQFQDGVITGVAS